MNRIKFLTLVLLIGISFHPAILNAQVAKTDNTRMNSFISNLMKQMTLDEKIGQLNLVTPGGGIATGAVVSADVEKKLKKEK